MRPHVPIDVVWDGTRVYRVPRPPEIEAVLLMADGLGSSQAAQAQGMVSREGSRVRVSEAQAKLRALSPAWALYQMYRLQIVPTPGRTGDPVLDAYQMSILDVVLRLGLPYDHAHKNLGIGRGALVRHMSEIYRLLGAATHTQVMKRAVETGDIEVDVPAQLWRGRI